MKRAILLFFALPLIVSADSVTLKSGKTLEGRILKESDQEILLETYGEGEITLPRADIRLIRKRKSKLDDYDVKASECEDTAEAHYQLGTWCKSMGLLRRADAEWLKAVERDPEHAAARKALKHVRKNDTWLTEEEAKAAEGFVKYQGKWVKKEAFERLRLAGAVECKLKVAVKPDADEAFFAAVRKRFEDAARMVWKACEGQMYISEVHIVDKCDQGDIVLNNLDSDHCDGTAYGRTLGGTQVLLGGKFLIVTFLHEWGHYKFGLPEEYIEPKCAHCAMEPWKGIFEFCDKSNHTGRGEDCWSAILKKHSGWKHPNLNYGDCPAVRITHENK